MRREPVGGTPTGATGTVALPSANCMNSVKRASVCALLWLALAALTAAQSLPAAEATNTSPQYRFEVWQTEEGLPQNTVSAIVQSREGYLWLGTYNGLVRFDGIRFKVFDSDNTPEFASNRILRLLEGRDGALWIGTDEGLLRYKGGRFTHYDTTAGLSDGSVSSLHEDAEGNLWVGTVGGGLNKLKNGEITSYTQKGNLPSKGEVTVLEGPKQNLWIATADYLGLFQDGEFVQFVSEPGLRMKVAACRQGGLWVSAGGRLKKFNDGQFVADLGPFPWATEGERVTALFEDRNENLWIGTARSGLFRFRGGVFQRIADKRGELKDGILGFQEDREGHLWIGTNGGGLVRLKERLFQMYDTENGLADNVVFSLCADQTGGVWIGTDGGGLDHLDNGAITNVTHPDASSLARLGAVYEDRNGTVWLGTRTNGIFQLRAGKFTHFSKAEGLSGESVRAIYEARNGDLWFGTADGGLNRFRQGKFTSLTTRDGLSHNDVRAILEDARGQLWIGTGGGGLNVWAEGKFRTFTKTNGLAGDFIRTLHEDKEGNLWIGTSSGLSRHKDGRFVTFKKKHGLPDELISQIFEDNRGDFWIGSNRGIFRVRKGELNNFAKGLIGSIVCVTYDQSDGLSSRECNGNFQPSGAKTKDGRLWFPTNKGVAVVDPNHLTDSKRPPMVVVEELYVDGTPVEMADTITINPGKERFVFTYTGINFAAPRRIKFKYQLVGYDPDWVDADTMRVAQYNAIPPGEYYFRVKAGNHADMWNQVGTSIKLVVTPPWWRTKWFIGLAWLAAAAALFGMYRFISLQKLRRKLDLLQQQHALEKERARIAKDMHDELGASLTQIGILSELAKRESANPPAVERHADKIFDTSRKVVNTLDEIVWAVNPKNDVLDKLAPYILQYAEEFFEITPIRCRLDAPGSWPACPVSAEIRHNLFLTVKEALNNIVKHAEASEVQIHLALHGPVFEILIEDNGKGFSPDPLDAAGNGLPNMRKRMEDIGGQFEMSSQPGKGTRLKVCVKLHL